MARGAPVGGIGRPAARGVAIGAGPERGKNGGTNGGTNGAAPYGGALAPPRGPPVSEMAALERKQAVGVDLR
jgi:hypothetical protein